MLLTLLSRLYLIENQQDTKWDFEGIKKEEELTPLNGVFLLFTV